METGVSARVRSQRGRPAPPRDLFAVAGDKRHGRAPSQQPCRRRDSVLEKAGSWSFSALARCYAAAASIRSPENRRERLREARARRDPLSTSRAAGPAEARWSHRDSNPRRGLADDARMIPDNLVPIPRHDAKPACDFSAIASWLILLAPLTGQPQSAARFKRPVPQLRPRDAPAAALAGRTVRGGSGLGGSLAGVTAKHHSPLRSLRSKPAIRVSHACACRPWSFHRAAPLRADRQPVQAGFADRTFHHLQRTGAT